MLLIGCERRKNSHFGGIFAAPKAYFLSSGPYRRRA
jgi:hypothetical protein